MGNREVKSFIFICVFVLILSAISIIAYINIRDAWMVKAVYAGTEDAQKFYERLSTMTEEDFYRALNKINTRCDAGRGDNIYLASLALHNRFNLLDAEKIMAQINNKENNSDYRIQMIAVAGKFFTYEEYSALYSIISDTTDNDGVRGAVLRWFPELKNDELSLLISYAKDKNESEILKCRAMIKLYSANADLWADTLSDIIDSYDAAKKDALKTALQNLSYNYYLDNKRFLKNGSYEPTNDQTEYIEFIKYVYSTDFLSLTDTAFRCLADIISPVTAEYLLIDIKEELTDEQIAYVAEKNYLPITYIAKNTSDIESTAGLLCLAAKHKPYYDFIELINEFRQKNALSLNKDTLSLIDETVAFIEEANKETKIQYESEN
jgi:hypothetical protein